MTVLAIDSSSRHRLLCALVADGGVLVDGEEIAAGRVSESLLPVVARLMAGSITAVVVVIGPGSFTGLRGGMAVALGVAHARDLPLHGIDAFSVVAAAGGAPACAEVLCDAGRGFVYRAVVDREHGRLAVSEAERRHLDRWRPGSAPAITFDDISAGGITRLSGALGGLAAASAVAVSRPALDRAGLAPSYLDETA